MAPTELKKCDIVMKGGITSGIIYPMVVSELAEHYQFQSIGGTSAGAIAASLTAAAESGRRKGRAAFAELAEIPSWLGADSAAGGGSNLFHLFQPQAQMKGLFRFATGFLLSGWLRRSWVWGRVLWLEILLGILPGAALLWLASGTTGWRWALAVVLGILAALAGIAITAAAGLLLRAKRLPSHDFGLCTGYRSGAARGNPVSLVAWLDEKLNELAGMSADHPLTFGDLKDAGVTLRMITTCLTFGRPFTLPFEAPELYYSPEEMERFFPSAIVSWMKAHPAAPGRMGEPVDAGALLPLPDADHLPVIFAARLSLSFPLLFCAVPLYAVDWTRRRRQAGEPEPSVRVPGDALGPDEVRKPERVWFSDGGICSNFPMHLFDSPLPLWPTFGINLRKVRPDRPGRIWMPTSNRGGVAHLWTRLSTQPGLGAAAALLPAILDAAQGWLENLQTSVPGYRDRIVHVYLDAREGGLNLNMPPDVVATLGDYGRLAAQRLIEHFIAGTDGGKATPMTWDNHRWTRCRSTMALLEVFLADFAHSLENPEPGDRSYSNLMRRDAKTAPESYRWLTNDQRSFAEGLAESSRDLGTKAGGGLLPEGAPRPTPALRIRPTF
jgi:predicted acylesterase/phospholipase RssA